MVKKKKLLTVSDIPFTVANSQTVYCLLLSWSELIFLQKGVFPTAGTTFTINVLHTLTVAVFSVILNKPKFSSAFIFHQTVEAHSYTPPFI